MGMFFSLYTLVCIYSDTSITNFMRLYREEISTTITPKLHMLEVHMVPLIKKWHYGMGLMGEQGAESIHTCFNAIKRSYVGIPNKVNRLHRVLQEHHLRIDPDNFTLALQ